MKLKSGVVVVGFVLECSAFAQEISMDVIAEAKTKVVASEQELG